MPDLRDSSSPRSEWPIIALIWAAGIVLSYIVGYHIAGLCR